MKPSVGRIVHYASTTESGAGKCWAAIITAVRTDGACHLSVFHPYESMVMVIAREGQAAGDWHWPERVE